MCLQVNSALQNQKAVTAYFSSKQILPLGFAWEKLSWNRQLMLLWKWWSLKRGFALILRLGPRKDRRPGITLTGGRDIS